MNKDVEAVSKIRISYYLGVDAMKRNAVLRMSFPSQRHLDTVYKALKPEARKPPTQRSKAALKKEGTSMILKIEARDTVALRATANAYLRWIASLTKILNVLEDSFR